MTRDDERIRAGASLRRAWWILGLRGLLAIGVGAVLLTRPGRAVAALLTVLGVYLLLDGVLALVATMQAAQGGRRFWPYLLEALLSIAVGILTFTRPSGTALAVLAVIAARAIITGVVEIGSGSVARGKASAPGWLLWLGGGSSIVFGVLLLVKPTVGALTLAWLAGIYGIVFGVSMAAEAIKLRSGAARTRLPV